MSTATFWNVCTKKEFEVDGETKSLWFKAGVIKVTQSGRKFLQLFQQPNVDFYVFEPEDEEETLETIE